MPEPYYVHHLFFCTNHRADGKDCCARRIEAESLRSYAKDRCKALNIFGPGMVRINSAGCLGRCDEGPVMVVYPEGVWYTFVDREDIDEIIDSHLRNGKVVERLRLRG